MITAAGRSPVRDVRSIVAMSTVVSIEVVRRASDADDAVARAFHWFRHVEAVCSRFDLSSEVVALSRQPGVPVVVSPIVLEAVRFALAVAADTGGAFDPTLGAPLSDRGFDVAYHDGVHVPAAGDLDRTATFRDVEVDPVRGTVTLHRPLLLDLGAVAKGLAVDLAARELAPFEHFAIDAGGDLFVGGHNAVGEPWALGIRHPRVAGAVIETVRLTGAALCTSGDYERPSPGAAGDHHILDPRRGASVRGLASVSVVAPTAMVADALATAAFVLGPREGLALLERQGVEGLMFTDALDRVATKGW